MDKQRDPAILKRKRQRRLALAIVGGVAIVAVSVAVSRLKPAAPAIANSDSVLWKGTVKRGSMVREVRGSGTLVPEEIRWITSSASGHVEHIVLQPGATVQPGTVILVLSNPDLDQSVRNAELDYQSALATLANQRATLANTRLSQESAVSDAESAMKLAQTDYDMQNNLFQRGLAADIQLKQKAAALEQAANRLNLAKRQLQSTIDTMDSQIAPVEAAANQRKNALDQLHRQVDDLKVKSTMSGRLQLVSVEEGQPVGVGVNLARVSDPSKLKAQIRISETQTKDLAVNQIADVDTRSGHVPGHVTRIDPASSGGTVGVDVELDGPLPPGARPDLSVDGTIQLERLENVLYIQSPAFGQENTAISLFKVLPTNEAVRTQVKIGRRSVEYVEVVSGLNEGDKVILSDMSQYDAFDRVRLN